MMRNLTLLISMLLVLSGCVQLAPVSHDGLLLQDSAGFGAVYAREGVVLDGYDQFAIDDCTVAFRANWLEDQNRGRRPLTTRVDPKDMAAIRSSVAALCDEAFRDMLLADPPYTVVDDAEQGPSTLVLRPAIVDLDVVAPDLRNLGVLRTFTAGAGAMTLRLEVADGHTGEVLFRVIDRQRDVASMDTGTGLRWSNRVTNRREADRMLRHWAKHLRDGLDRVMRE
jgi:hypothetical protein